MCIRDSLRSTIRLRHHIRDRGLLIRGNPFAAHPQGELACVLNEGGSELGVGGIAVGVDEVSGTSHAAKYRSLRANRLPEGR